MKKTNLQPIQCKICLEINRPVAKFCYKCVQLLTEQAVVKQQGIIQSLNAMIPNLTPEQLAAIADLVTKKMQENALRLNKPNLRRA